MARPNSSSIVEALRREFVPFLQSCTEPEQLPEILRRLAGCLGADGAILWRADDEQLLMQCTTGSARQDWATAHASNTAGAAAMRRGAGIVAEAERGPYAAAEIGESLAQVAAVPVRGILVAPLVADGHPLGAIEAVRGPDSALFSEEDLRVLVDVAKQATVALRNAQRLQAERRVKELQALAEISQEITATLDIDRVLSTAVNRITAVLPVNRSSISILRKGRREMAAISGQVQVDRTKPGVPDLISLHEWLGGLDGDMRTARWITFSSSRTLPRQENASRRFRTSGETLFPGSLPCSEKNRRKWFTSNGMSSLRSRSGGKRKGSTFKRKKRSSRNFPCPIADFSPSTSAATPELSTYCSRSE